MGSDTADIQYIMIMQKNLSKPQKQCMTCPLSCVFAGNGTLTKQTPLIGASRAYLCRELYIPISPSARESQKFLIVIWLLAVSLGQDEGIDYIAID